MKKDYKKELLTINELNTLMDELKTKDDSFNVENYEKAHTIIQHQIMLLPIEIKRNISVNVENRVIYYCYNYVYKKCNLLSLALNPLISTSKSYDSERYMTILDLTKTIERFINNDLKNSKLTYDGHTKRFYQAKNILKDIKSLNNSIIGTLNVIEENKKRIKDYESYIARYQDDLKSLMK